MDLCVFFLNYHEHLRCIGVRNKFNFHWRCFAASAHCTLPLVVYAVRFRHRLMVEWIGEWHCTVTADGVDSPSQHTHNMLFAQTQQREKKHLVCNRAQIFALLDELYYHKFVVLSNCDNIMFSWLDFLALVFTCLILITWSDAFVSAWFFSETNKNRIISVLLLLHW